MASPLLLLVGPTAVGKTSVSVPLAEEAGGEIVSVDSRQVYERIDVGTAKPSAGERERVPHHLIDERPLEREISAGAYVELAEERIAEIQSRSKTPLLVGGSTLYVKALKEGLADIPDVDEAVRDRLNERLEEEGAEVLFEELREVDPEAASTMDPTKTQRIVRALEVYHGTGRPITYYHEEAQDAPEFAYRTIVLNREREKLHARIAERVEQMLEEGLVEEVEALREDGYTPENTGALRTIGYKEVFSFLRGEIPEDEMVRLLKRNTRRYAKRQITWFRRDEGNEWLRIPEKESPEETAERVRARIDGELAES